MAAPVQSVIDALKSGVTSRAVIARECGLQQSTVDAVVEYLEHSGRLSREEMRSCVGSCSSCAVAGSCGSGPVLLTLQPLT